MKTTCVIFCTGILLAVSTTVPAVDAENYDSLLNDKYELISSKLPATQMIDEVVGERWFNRKLRARTTVNIYDNGNVRVRTFFENGQRLEYANMSVVVRFYDSNNELVHAVRHYIEDMSPSFLGASNKKERIQIDNIGSKLVKSGLKAKFQFDQITPKLEQATEDFILRTRP